MLLEDGFSKSDISKGIKVLKTKKITMGKETQDFEKKFAKKLGVKYALMVNSDPLQTYSLLLLHAIH